jgi:hypothetical protein
MMNVNQQQMELSLAGANRCPRLARHEPRRNHARWWFDQMRQVVERAIDWEPAPLPRPEQIWFSDTSRQARG